MLRKELVHKLLYFDVETVGLYPALGELEIVNPRLFSMWKKREDYYKGAYSSLANEESEKIYKQKAGLEPEFSRVVCVSFGSFTEDGEKVYVSFSGKDEIDILNKSNKVFNNAMAKGWKLCGHNIKGFDVPCLGKRMIYNGINPSGNLQIWDKKPWEVPYMDTSEIFAFGSWAQQKYLSLDLLTCSLDIDSPKSDMDGSKVNDTFWFDDDMEKIELYCEADVRAVMTVMEKICF